jgi:hypothetical protein
MAHILNSAHIRQMAIRKPAFVIGKLSDDLVHVAAFEPEVLPGSIALLILIHCGW